MEDKSIRTDEVSDCRQRGIICKGPNLNPSQIFKSICNTIINNPILTIKEVDYLINDLIIIRDAQNIIEETGEKRQCEYCNKQVIAITYCEGLYIAKWEIGPFKEWDAEKQVLKRGDNDVYILKSLKNSKTADELWLKNAIKSLTFERFSQSLIKCYGLTRNHNTLDFMIVFQCMDSNLSEFLAKKELSWKTRFKMVRNISNSIRKIHNQEEIHKNLHSKNILVDEAKPHCVVGDFGIYKPLEKSNQIYGNLPYIAPEVLHNNSYTIKSDIYSLGMIMWEISSGMQPFYDQMKKPDNELALDIINGMRPKVVDGTPPDYADLMIKCWDACPKNRPDAKTIMKKMANLLQEIYETDGVYKELKLIPIKISKKKMLINFVKSKFKRKKKKKLPSNIEIKNTLLVTEKNKDSSLATVEKGKSQISATERDESLLLVTAQNKSRIYEFENL
ncbi:7456_t:CDS:2 [Cetraspora pellucida]|uniref:7456_t:CDS:1 n=1 Tax=Cetraspora pellucida TaxID=1433469 RepID=A0A9N9FDD0_9GLOM|nr:7456_t:CDS:2 [Cetraspora pellucida]